MIAKRLERAAALAFVAVPSFPRAEKIDTRIGKIER